MNELKKEIFKKRNGKIIRIKCLKKKIEQNILKKQILINKI
jgi:hypothetical protein